MPEPVEVTLPHGLAGDGGRRRDAVLRPLTGADEAFLLDEGAGLTPARRTTALLARCLLRLGSREPVGEEAVRALVSGDRQALLLHLRRATFGEGLVCVLDCPACGEALEVELTVGRLLVEPYPDEPVERDADLEGVPVRLRLPTGADEEEAAAIAAAAGVEAAETALLERCVVRPAPVPAGVSGSVSELLGRLDPQADVVLELVCPVCGEPVSTPFDAGDYLVRETAAGRDDLLQEIHLLALHYGWPESELVAMTPRRRRRYVDHLLGAVGA